MVMALHPRRVVILLLSAFAVLALWHLAIVGRASPDAWSRGEYAGANNVLSGWSAGLCKTTGVCGNWLVHTGDQPGEIGGDKKIKKKLKKAPEFVLEYGVVPRVSLEAGEG